MRVSETNGIKPTLRAARKKRGFTLTEIAIVLGIIGLILGAIWSAAASVYNNQRIAHANTDILQMAQGIRGLYASSSSTGYTAAVLITGALQTAGVTPSDLGIPASNLLNGPFPGGSTAVISTSDGNGFVIAMSGIPQAGCIALLTAVGGASRDPGLFNVDAVTSAAPAVGDATTTGTGLTTAVTPVTAAATTTGTPGTSGQGGCTNPLNKARFGFTVK
jgi:prepilin-type N-terminal cleavage/methylation domain-containing protein